jgi:hypothetical protein
VNRDGKEAQRGFGRKIRQTIEIKEKKWKGQRGRKFGAALAMP